MLEAAVCHSQSEALINRQCNVERCDRHALAISNLNMHAVYLINIYTKCPARCSGWNERLGLLSLSVNTPNAQRNGAIAEGLECLFGLIYGVLRAGQFNRSRFMMCVVCAPPLVL